MRNYELLITEDKGQRFNSLLIVSYLLNFKYHHIREFNKVNHFLFHFPPPL